MKIVVLKGMLKESHEKKIEDTAEKVGAKVCFVKDEKDIPEDFKDAEVIYGFGINTAKTSKALKWMCVPSAGVDAFVEPGFFANDDCLLSNSSGAYGVTIAEHIIAVTLMMMRKLTYTYEEILNGVWGLPKPQKSLKDCRITVLGTGDIGRTFAKRAKAFEPENIIGVCRSGKSDEESFDRVVKIEDLEEVLKETDLLVMSLPDTPETKGILSEDKIKLLPEGAYIVNVGRGSAIDEIALAKYLENGKLGGAALDVFVNEPLPKESPLWKTKNLLITPHNAGNLTLDYTLNKNVDMFCEDLLNYSNGLLLKYIVDRKKGY
ncbi:MAG: D-2-hydroxyacid dehydrogenase [Lachnospiraceae bacterium]|nr:D-2-hydroxyacid dehydrogenase [Lachnospiraceae bacterium]